MSHELLREAAAIIEKMLAEEDMVAISSSTIAAAQVMVTRLRAAPPLPVTDGVWEALEAAKEFVKQFRHYKGAESSGTLLDAILSALATRAAPPLPESPWKGMGK